MVCLCEKSKKLSDFKKGGEFVDKMNDIQFLSEDALQGIIHKNIYHHIFSRIK
jgi:hypothetical protein